MDWWTNFKKQNLDFLKMVFKKSISQEASDCLPCTISELLWNSDSCILPICSFPTYAFIHSSQRWGQKNTFFCSWVSKRFTSKSEFCTSFGKWKIWEHWTCIPVWKQSAKPSSSYPFRQVGALHFASIPTIPYCGLKPILLLPGPCRHLSSWTWLQQSNLEKEGQMSHTI